MEDLFFYFLVGMVGGDIANEIAKKDRKTKIPIQLLFSISFSTIYIIGLIFFSLVYFFRGYKIPWANLGIFCIIIASLIATIIFLLEKLVKR